MSIDQREIPVPSTPQPWVLPPRRPQPWSWVVAAVGVVVALVVGVAALVGSSDTLFSHQLLRVDFNAGGAPFVTGRSSEYDVTAVDGVYRMAATAVSTSPAVSYAWSSRTAYAFELSATVTSETTSSAVAMVGLGCYDDPRGNGHGYHFLVGASFMLARVDGADVTPLMMVPTERAWPLSGQRLTLVCQPQGLGDGRPVLVRGLVDGQEVVRWTDPGGFDTYKAAALLFSSTEVGIAARFDDVLATLPTS